MWKYFAFYWPQSCQLVFLDSKVLLKMQYTACVMHKRLWINLICKKGE